LGKIYDYDFSGRFNLTNLDLREVNLGGFKLSSDENGAILNKSLLGLGSFDLKGHDDAVWSIEISQDKKWALSSSPNSVRLWDFATKKCKSIIFASDRLMLDFQRTDAKFHPNNNACVYFVDNCIFLFDMRSERRTMFYEHKNKIKYIKQI
jgi:WD40 repeat protein